jgi:putative intracellular protease/amidase
MIKNVNNYWLMSKLSDIDVDNYAALVYVGGHGPCFDLPTDSDNIRVAEEFWKKGKVVSAVCHGPAAIG